MQSPGLGDQGCMEFSSHKPHFFKVILDDADRCEKLRIPRKFTKRYGSEISSPVFLKVPSGAVWEVELRTCDDDMWLHNGWTEFAKRYSIGYGSFLVFRYEGNCHFHVIILDKTASEIAYPYSRTHGKVPNNGGFQDLKREEDEDDILVEILDGIPASKKTRVQSPMMTSASNFRPSDIQSTGVKYEMRETEFTAKTRRRGKHPQQMEVCRRKTTLGRKEKAKALLLASSFKSKNPFFVVVMQPSYVYNKCRMGLPVNFWRKYFPKHNGDAILCICDGKTWSIVYSRETRPKLHCGWKVFVRENNLEVGDVCVFELINQTKIAFNVAIFHSVQDAKIAQSPAKVGGSEWSSTAKKCHMADVPSRKPASQPTEKARVPQRFTLFQSENPFFTVTIQPSHVHSAVSVPYFFVQENINENAKNVKLQVGDRLWPVKLLRYPQHKKPKPNSGWGAFVRENSVEVGEVCVFELIDREDAVLKVHIFRKSAE